MTSATSAEAKGTGFWSATRLVAEREIVAQLRSKGLWLTFGLFVVGIIAAAIVPNLIDGGPPKVAVVGSNVDSIDSASVEMDLQPVGDVDEAEDLIRSGDVDGAIMPDSGSPVGVRIIALTDQPEEIVRALSSAPPVELLEPSDVNEGTRFLATFTFALVFFMVAFGFGMAIAQSVVTEKQTRIVEILVATVPVRALLAGKIIGFSLLVFAQIAVLAVITPIALRSGDQGALLDELSGAIGWFVPFFVVGFVLLATLWAVSGAIVSRQEDLGSSTSVVMTLVMVPYFAVMFANDNAGLMTVMSYIPFSAPIAMPVRMFTDDVSAWEPILSLAILLATLVACVLAASRLYSGSLLQTGARVKLSRAWSSAE